MHLPAVPHPGAAATTAKPTTTAQIPLQLKVHVAATVQAIEFTFNFDRNAAGQKACTDCRWQECRWLPANAPSRHLVPACVRARVVEVHVLVPITEMQLFAGCLSISCSSSLFLCVLDPTPTPTHLYPPISPSVIPRRQTSEPRKDLALIKVTTTTRTGNPPLLVLHPALRGAREREREREKKKNVSVLPSPPLPSPLSSSLSLSLSLSLWCGISLSLFLSFSHKRTPSPRRFVDWVTA